MSFSKISTHMSHLDRKKRKKFLSSTRSKKRSQKYPTHMEQDWDITKWDKEQDRIDKLLRPTKHIPKDLRDIIFGYVIDTEPTPDPKDNYNGLILDEYVSVNHDGYDCWGPQSYLYDLYLVYELDQTIYVTYWHRENWFGWGIEDQLYYHEYADKLDNFLKRKGSYEEHLRKRFSMLK